MKPITDWTKRDWNTLTHQLFLASILFWVLKTYGGAFMEGFFDGFTLASQAALS